MPAKNYLLPCEELFKALNDCINGNQSTIIVEHRIKPMYVKTYIYKFNGCIYDCSYECFDINNHDVANNNADIDDIINKKLAPKYVLTTLKYINPNLTSLTHLNPKRVIFPTYYWKQMVYKRTTTNKYI